MRICECFVNAKLGFQVSRHWQPSHSTYTILMTYKIIMYDELPRVLCACMQNLQRGHSVSLNHTFCKATNIRKSLASRLNATNKMKDMMRLKHILQQCTTSTACSLNVRQHVLPRRRQCRAFCSQSDNGDRYSTSEDDVVGFGRVIRDPRKTKTDILRETLVKDEKAGLEKTGKPIILDSNQSDAQWKQLDEHINEYPGLRTFKAIGMGGEDFAKAMRACVEIVLGKIGNDAVATKPSSGGKYISVTFGPVRIESSDQMKEIYERMQQDGRMKFFI